MKRRKSIRLKGYDYRTPNKYFVTTNIKNRIPYFGEVIDSNMVLSEAGRIVDEQWCWLEKQYPYVRNHAHIVMPDHFHGILEIKRNFTDVKPLTTLISAFKTRSSSMIRKSGIPEFTWQRTFYDDRIRNNRHLENVIQYIYDNPSSWKGP